MPKKFRPTLFHGTVEFVATYGAVIVGLGNFWRFPFMAYDNGGGAFVFACGLLYIMLGKPVMLLEMAIGQFSRKGNITAFYRFGAAYTGIGVTQLCANIYALSYYAVVVAISLYYFSQSFHEHLPWTLCDHNYPHANICVPSSKVTEMDVMPNHTHRYTSEQLYLMHVIFMEDDVSSGIGPPNWGIAVSLFMVWLFTFINLRVGIIGMGVFNYFFCLVPWIMTLMLVGKAMSLPGSLEGVKYLFTINWSRLCSPKLWVAASAQVIFSVGLGFGTTTMYASYTCINTNIKTASTVIVLMDCGITVLISIAVFATVSNIAYEFQTKFAEVIVTGHSAFVFIVYSYLMSTYYLPPVASAMFFLVLTLNGLESLVSFVHVITTQFMDIIHCCSDTKLNLFICVCGVFFGLPFLTPQGQLFIRTVDFFGVTMILCIISLLECTVICYCYGLRQFCWDVEFTVGERPDLTSIMGWRMPGIIALLDTAVFVMGVTEMLREETSTHGLLVAAGWIMMIASCIPIPMLAVSTIILNYKKGCPQMVKSAISKHRWKPGDPEDLPSYRYFVAEKRKELQHRHYRFKILKLWDAFVGY